MSYQSKGLQFALLVHAAVFLLFTFVNVSESRLNRPVVIDFSIIRDSEEIAEMPGPGDPGLPFSQGEKTENRVVDNMPDQPVTETLPAPCPPVPPEKKEPRVRPEKTAKSKAPVKKIARAERKKSPPVKQAAEKREKIPVAKQVQATGSVPAAVQAEETVKESPRPMVSNAANSDVKPADPVASDTLHSDTEDRQPAQSLAENSAASSVSKDSGSSDSKARNMASAGYGKSGSGGVGNGSLDNIVFGSGANAPKYIHQQDPVYPFRARRLGKQGKVVLRLTIDEKGKLVNVEVMEDIGYGLADAAVAAVKKSTFSPATVNGKPVKARALLPVKFALK